MGVKDYSELRVYRLSFDSAMRVFRCSATWPREERYSLTDQIRRSTRAVSGCLAEAWSKRAYPAYFVSKVTDALGECRETQVWLDYAASCGYLDPVDYQDLRAAYDRIAGMLMRMAREPDRWAGPAPH